MRSNKKEGGLLRRKGNRDVGPYLDKESFLHSSGFFGDGFMPNIPASVVRKREQASGKHKEKTQPVKMGFPKMMLNSLMQRLNLPNMRQLLKGTKKSKPPPNEAVKGSDEYPYPFHSIPSSALPPKNVKKPPPKPPQKVPIGILTPEFDRPLPLFVKSLHDEDPLRFHQMPHSDKARPQVNPPPSPPKSNKLKSQVNSVQNSLNLPSPPQWPISTSHPHPQPAAPKSPLHSQEEVADGFVKDHLATRGRLPTSLTSLSSVPITPFVHHPSLNQHQQQQHFSLPQRGNPKKPLTSTFGESKKPSGTFFQGSPGLDDMFFTERPFETTKEDEDTMMSFVHGPSLSNKDVFSHMKGFDLDDLGESLDAFKNPPSLPSKPHLNMIFSDMNNFGDGGSQKDDIPMTAFVHSSHLENSLDGPEVAHLDEKDTLPKMTPFVHTGSSGKFESFFPPLVTDAASPSKPSISAPLKPVAAVWESQVPVASKVVENNKRQSLDTSAFSSFDESSHVIGLGLRRQVPLQGDYGSKQFVEEEATTMSTYVYRPKTLYRKDTNKMKKKEQLAHFPKKTYKERRRKKVVEVSMMEKEQEAALNRLLSIAGEDWSKVEKLDR